MCEGRGGVLVVAALRCTEERRSGRIMPPRPASRPRRHAFSMPLPAMPQALCDMGYSASDIITILFKVVRNSTSMHEFVKLEYIKVGGRAWAGGWLGAILVCMSSCCDWVGGCNWPADALRGSSACCAANRLLPHAGGRWRQLATAAVGPAGGSVQADAEEQRIDAGVEGHTTCNTTLRV